MKALRSVCAALLLAAFSGCTPVCDDVWSVQQDPVCWSTTPCADFVYTALDRSTMVCRPDQSASVEWEPALTGVRNDEETCRCGGCLSLHGRLAIGSGRSDAMRDPMRLELDRHRADTDGAPIGRATRRGIKGKARTALRAEQIEQVEPVEADGETNYRKPSR